MEAERFLIPVISELPVYNTFLGMSWGVYGWVSVWFSYWLTKVFPAIVAVVSAIRDLGAAPRPRRAAARAADGGGGRFLLTMVAGLLGGVHLTDYRFLASDGAVFAKGLTCCRRCPWRVW